MRNSTINNAVSQPVAQSRVALQTQSIPMPSTFVIKPKSAFQLATAILSSIFSSTTSAIRSELKIAPHLRFITLKGRPASWLSSRYNKSVQFPLTYAMAMLVLITACQSVSQRRGVAASPTTTWHTQTLNTNSLRKTKQQIRPKTSPVPRSATPKRPSPTPTLVPIVESRGIVVLVNTQSQFIVADFSFNPIPVPGQRLGIFRNGERVGEAKTTAFTRGSLVAADTITGEARVDDEVRAE